MESEDSRDDDWTPHRIGSELITEELFRDYCSVLNDGHDSWHKRRTKLAGGEHLLPEYEAQRAKQSHMNWERASRGWGVIGETSPSNAVTWKDVEEEIVLGWLTTSDERSIRRFYIGRGTGVPSS